MLAGLEPIDEGEVRIDGEDMTFVQPRNRDIAMVFQNYALYPSMTVAANMGFALKQKGMPKQERNERVAEAARILDLGDYLERKPRQLSGGQRQRVAMGRAIVRSPKVFLMDEPLSNLDAKLRVQTRTEISALQARLGVTTVYVTHDQVEAMTMGHRVAVLDGGRLQQLDSPRALYDEPENLFVAGFIGSPAMNLLTAPIDGQNIRLGSLSVPLGAAREQLKGHSEAVIGVRPEALALSTDGISGQIVVVDELGADAFVHVDIAHGDDTARLMVRTGGASPPARGENVKVSIQGRHYLFTPEGDRVTSA
jgi:multiple sugar transport system ATP-binding protein